MHKFEVTTLKIIKLDKNSLSSEMCDDLDADPKNDICQKGVHVTRDPVKNLTLLS